MTDWHDIEYCHQGEGDRFGLCFWTLCGNNVALLGKGTMSIGEIENAAREMAGFSPYDNSTDRGEDMREGFRYIHDEGWPGDPTLTIASWSKIDPSEIPAVIARRLSAASWVMLPMTPEGDAYDFSDTAVDRNSEAVYAHAMLIVEANDDGLWMITWGRPQFVSHRWARRYLQEAFEVVWSDIA